jgi:hypothetical protein
MNPPQESSCSQRPDEFLPLRRVDSETRRQSRNPTWWNTPNFAHESFEDPFKAEKEGKDLKANATTMASASFIKEDDAPNPAEEALSFVLSPSSIQCEQAPKKFTSVPADTQITSATVTDADAIDEQEETTAVRNTSRLVPRVATGSPSNSCDWHVLTKRTILRAAKATVVVDIDDSAAKIDERVDAFQPFGSPPTSPKRKSRQTAKDASVVDTDEYQAETKEEVEQTVGRSDDIDIDDYATPTSPSSHASWVARSVALRRTPPVSPKQKGRQVSKETVVVDTDAYYAETKEKVGKTVARSVATDIDDSATPSSPSSPSSHASWVARSVALRRTPTASPKRKSHHAAKHTAGADTDEHHAKTKEKVEKKVTQSVDPDTDDSTATSYTSWVALAGPVRTTYQARVAKKTAVVDTEDVLKNKGVTPTEKNIEWEKPDWAKSRELKATGKADVLKNEGNLGRPISVPVGSNKDTGSETETNIAWTKPDWTKCPALKTTNKGAARGAPRD